MKNPFRRTPPRDPRVESALRHSLAEHARQAPAGEDVTDRVLAAVEGTRPAPDPYRGPSRWRAWTLPLVAAGSVAAVVGVVAGIQQLDQPAHRPSALTTHSPSGPHSVTPTVPVPTTSAPALPTTTTSKTSTTSSPVDTSTLHNVKILDLTFAGLDDGWALAVADCIGHSGRCPALLRTHDGTIWKSMPGTEFNVPGQTGGCTAPCVQHIRFATDRIGYAYGSNALLMTTDGGLHWTPRPGGALFLETLKQNVIRVTSSGPGCPGPCNVRVQTAPLGGTTWTTQLGPLNTSGVQFSRGGDDAYLLVTGHVAGGGQDATSTLYRSQDDGATWQQGAEPCPQTGSVEVDSTAIAAGAGGGVAVLCAQRGKVSGQFVAVATDHGVHFAGEPGRIRFYADQLTGDPATEMLAAGRSGMALSTNGGQTWTPVSYPIARVSFAGFESAQVGRVVAADGTEIWTTRDGGNSWTKVLFN